MCDYSLEVYRSRPAREDEHYVTHRFSTGSVGFIAPGDPVTAVCMACDMQLDLRDIPQGVQVALATKSTERVTFTRLEGLFQDGIRFADGTEISLQRLGPGVKATVVNALASHRVLESVETM